jgi:hypothetical protein
VRHHAKASSAGSTPALATFSSLLRGGGSGAPSLRFGFAPLLALTGLGLAALALAAATVLALLIVAGPFHTSLGSIG